MSAARTAVGEAAVEVADLVGAVGRGDGRSEELGVGAGEVGIRLAVGGKYPIAPEPRSVGSGERRLTPRCRRPSAIRSVAAASSAM
ncbi:hypothetical protein [Luethyella okanaganae]|uniref:Uncharacterized protein n=1 Tax=Luethyella okanaganae TaxID=69372 RepID=A0ABW1VDL3_9MICO